MFWEKRRISMTGVREGRKEVEKKEEKRRNSGKKGYWKVGRKKGGSNDGREKELWEEEKL
jgi:hypothetical protein